MKKLLFSLSLFMLLNATHGISQIYCEPPTYPLSDTSNRFPSDILISSATLNAGSTYATPTLNTNLPTGYEFNPYPIYNIDFTPGTSATFTIKYQTPSAMYFVPTFLWIDFNANGTFDSTESIIAGFPGVQSTGINNYTTYTFNFNIPNTASSNSYRMRLVSTLDPEANSMRPCAYLVKTNYYDFEINAEAPKVDSIRIKVSNNLPAEIVGINNTLQLEANIFPGTLPQGVRWSIINGTGNATIDSNGNVTALALGNVFAKAVSLYNSLSTDSLEIQIKETNTNDSTNSINTTKNNSDINLYPNPTKTEFTIYNNAELHIDLISIIDINGRVIFNKKISNNNKSIVINSSKWAKGIYTLQILTKQEGTHQIRIIKD